MGDRISKNTLTNDDLTLLHNLSGKPKDEILFWYDHFITECPSGKLDKEKFVKYYKSFRKSEIVDEMAQHCFSAFDFDKNGYVDFGEFLIAYVATTNGDPREKLKFAFDVYDQDNNKVLDEREIRIVLRSMFKLLNMNESSVNMDKCLENIMSTLDENKDSKISKGEFIDGVLADPLLYHLLSPFT